MLSFIRHNIWGVVLVIAALICFIGSFWTNSGLSLTLALVSAVAIGISSWLCFSYSLFSEPTRFVISHDNWTFYPDTDGRMPYVIIHRADHKRGKSPRVEFQQVDPIYGVPNFPVSFSKGDITITRPQGSSLGIYPTFAILIHKH